MDHEIDALRLREFCVNELCIVMHRGANEATGILVSY